MKLVCKDIQFFVFRRKTKCLMWIHLLNNARTLTIEKSGLFNNNKAMTYSLDGWTGRYGMHIDFLISVHLATMMPDLAYDMANSFETEIRMILHRVTGADVQASYLSSGQYVTYDQFEQFASEGITGGIHGWRIGPAEAMKIMKVQEK